MKNTVKRLKKMPRMWFNGVCCKLNHLFKRISMRMEIGAFPLAFCMPWRLNESVARIMGDLANLVDDLLPKNVWRMGAPGLQILFVGSRGNSLALSELLTDHSAAPEYIGQTWTFGLSRKTTRSLDQGYDLVIYELSRIHWFRSPAPLAFSARQLIGHLLEYPEGKYGEPLQGTRFHDIRRRVRRAQSAGFEWRFSRSRSDYDFFYERMYVPFLRARHGELAQINSVTYHWDLLIQKAGGGLVLISKGDRQVAGAVCFIADKTCYGVEMGFVDGDTRLFKQGVNAMLFWAVAEWGKRQGATYYNLGENAALRSNRIYRSKSRLGTKVVRARRANRVVVFSANRLMPWQKEVINSVGFVCFSCLFSAFTSSLMSTSKMMTTSLLSNLVYCR